MNKLVESIMANTTIRHKSDQMTERYTAELCFFMDLAHMKPVSEDVEEHIYDHLRKSMRYYMLDLAYGDMKKDLYTMYGVAGNHDCTEMQVALDEFLKKHFNE